MIWWSARIRCWFWLTTMKLAKVTAVAMLGVANYCERLATAALDDMKRSRP